MRTTAVRRYAPGFNNNTNNDAKTEESYLYFSGNWGRLNLGRENGAAYLLQVAAPSADPNIDGMDIDFSFVDLTSRVSVGGSG